MSVLSLENINFSYGARPVLKDVSLSFEKGKMYCIVANPVQERLLCFRFCPGLLPLTAGRSVTKDRI